MKRLLVLLLLCPTLSFAESYYQTQQYRVIPDTTTNKTSWVYRGDVYVGASSNTANANVVLRGTGTVESIRFVGSGAALTSLTPANISAGSLPATVIASSVAASSVYQGALLGNTSSQAYHIVVDSAIYVYNSVSGALDATSSQNSVGKNWTTVSTFSYISLGSQTEGELWNSSIGLAGLWHFNEDSGATAADIIASSRTMTVESSSWTAGNYGSAIWCVVSNTAPYTTNCLDQLSNITLMCWVNIPTGATGNTYGTPFGIGSDVNGLAIRVSNLDQPGWIAPGVAAYDAGGLAIARGTWTHLALVRRNAVTELYVNATRVSVTNNTPLSPTDKTYVGRAGPTYGSFHGAVDDCAAFYIPLQPQDIMKYYLFGRSKFK